MAPEFVVAPLQSVADRSRHHPASRVAGDTDDGFPCDPLSRLTEANDDDSVSAGGSQPVQLNHDSLSRVPTEVKGDNPRASGGRPLVRDAESPRRERAAGHRGTGHEAGANRVAASAVTRPLRPPPRLGHRHASGVAGDTGEEFPYDPLSRLTEAKDDDGVSAGGSRPVQLNYDRASRLPTEVQGRDSFPLRGNQASHICDPAGDPAAGLRRHREGSRRVARGEGGLDDGRPLCRAAAAASKARNRSVRLGKLAGSGVLQ